MDPIKNEALRLLNIVLQYPPTVAEKWTSVAVAVLACAWIFLKVGDRMNLPNVGMITSFIYTGLGVTAIFLAMAAAHIYVAGIEQKLGATIFRVAVAVIVSLFIVVPLINMFINGKYLGTLLAWSLGIVTAIVAIALVANISAFIQGGEQVFDRGKQHNDATKEMLK